ncbi:MAG TPA: hypothetical protein VMT62_02250 [Syntrophorhabdaceae bacterium]|nr:hypothetical protein [Syntrophorhabdaceae bacterium]
MIGKSKSLLVLALFMLILNLCAVYGQAQTDEEQYIVFCYIGDPERGDFVDSIDTFHPLQATELCNDAYIDCNGRCTGCYLGSEGEEVCTGPSGRRFVK